MSYCGLFVLWCLDVVKFAEIAIGIILCGSNKFDLMFIGLVLKYSFVYLFEECDVLIAQRASIQDSTTSESSPHN